MIKRAEANRILKLVSEGRFRMAEHTFIRCNDRGISRAQIIHCAQRYVYHKWQESKQTHLFVGYLDDTTSGGFSAVMRDEVIIVTVFRRRLTQWEKKLVKFKRP